MASEDGAAAKSPTFVLGFQGWFACPGDGHKGGGEWRHWFRGKDPIASKLSVEMLPDVSQIPAEERCKTHMVDPAGRPVELFSDQYARTVKVQFDWLRRYGLDCIAVQRFVVGLQQPSTKHDINRVLDNVRAAAEGTGRSFFVTYDMAGADARTWAETLAADWQDLMGRGLLSSLAYACDNGRPLLGLAGPGFRYNRPATPEQTRHLISRLRQATAAYGRVRMLGLLPRNWRTLDRDSRSESGWAAVYRSFDIIAPWLVGSMATQSDIDRYVQTTLIPDLLETQRNGIALMPVVFPGFSWTNLVRHQKASRFNAIPRECGHFFWDQVIRYKQAGVTRLYAAMFDEVDEGTAVFKVLARRSSTPVDASVLTLDADGCNLPTDYYLRLAGEAARLMRARTVAGPIAVPR